MKLFFLAFGFAAVIITLCGAIVFPENQLFAVATSMAVTFGGLATAAALVATSILGTSVRWRVFAIGTLTPVALAAFGNAPTCLAVGYIVESCRDLAFDSSSTVSRRPLMDLSSAVAFVLICLTTGILTTVIWELCNNRIREQMDVSESEKK